MIRVSKDAVMTSTLLADLITKHKIEVEERHRKLYNAYLGDYEIFKKSKKAEYKPDNRIAANYAKYLTDTMTGFFIGKPVTLSLDEENERDKDKINDYITLINSYNSINDQNAELSKLSSIFGAAYEMYYTDERSQICTAKVSPLEGFMVYDDSVIPKKKFFIRYYKDADGHEVGSYTDDKVVQYFTLGAGYYFNGEPKGHGFGDVPATEFKENEERKGLFEGQMSLINEYNKALSEKANDVDYFADAYMKILGAPLKEETLNSIRDNRIINLDSGDTGKNVIVDFLDKPDSDGTQENLLNRMERLIYTLGMVADMSDDSFGTASGVAIRYKLWAMDSLAGTKERKFESALQERYKTIFSHDLARQYVKEDDWMKIKFKFTRNYPANVADEVSIAKNLEGMVSRETQLANLSIVEDVQGEIERLQNEQEEAQTKAMEMMGLNEQ